MGDVALIREDTGDTLVLTGAVRYTDARDARVTDWPIPDRSYLSDALQLLPRRIDVEGVVSPRGQIETYLHDTESWLETVQIEAVALSFQDADGGLVPMMLVESFQRTVSGSSGWRFRVSLKSIRLAQSREVLIETQSSVPPPSFRSATSDPVDAGTGAAEDVSLAQGVVNTLLRAVGS